MNSAPIIMRAGARFVFAPAPQIDTFMRRAVV
jgi:hypothetical protein